MPMDLFRENAALARIFIPGWRANHCPWIFSMDRRVYMELKKQIYFDSGSFCGDIYRHS
ncbi:hypothetical protein GsuE55_36250 [Geobacillus subterraneus]|uniref:Uncharacterized protein n=1 Tax=Geobacillus subterraneus TaxID=129338 RepID=A0A679FQ61_9BACL|nr:hypothetical protein GsuE55_36250 [Geobacillus subterraneus]